ncbi:hypothetical protein SNE25_02415 [Mucilaginibacter sabulilitoris]|uniref:MG2 domain-containing protein n=1 Tax=Mucilaginibacter sabulilitoris TaxID=1173583 RepID=A0ABZ0TMI1_9SPHI|nr:hypothetical protein [Mucilaginibacter sabulilitoris]WPU94376.1 hypothetical protein SNE25_02415 [Mucilaginibacter sabulilitoris]
MKILWFTFLLLFLFLQNKAVYGQTDPRVAVRDIVNAVTKRSDSLASEKIYLQTDKPVYTTGDTLRFKAYLFNAVYLAGSDKSGMAYIEIADEQNKVVKREMVSMYMGLGWGDIALGEKEFPQGGYILRAYTSWMRNFDTQYIFKKQFYISSPGETDLLIRSAFTTKQVEGKQHIGIGLQIHKTDHLPLVLGSFQLKITTGNKVWYRDKVQTSVDGSIDVNFDVPEKADTSKLAVTLQSLKKDESGPILSIPVILNRPEYTDLQFMPEGGYMVAGINTHIAFKAIAEDGRGTSVSGLIYNNKQQQIAAFQSAHLGIGSFDIIPQPGETYTAKIKLPDGLYSKPYDLPPVKSSGQVLNVINKLTQDSLEINIAATADLEAANPVYYLVGQSRGIACYGAVIRLRHGASKIRISKTSFPTGIARLSLLNINKQALNERIVYINRNDNLRIALSSDKRYYTKRDSVAVSIEVTDKNGQPVLGSFSVAITDDSQVKNDSLKNNTLKSALLLTSDLKGTVEDPGYYFQSGLTAAQWQHLDNLLLAQGWVNYDWPTVFRPITPALNPAEQAFAVKGKVSNMFNKPVEKAGVMLLSKKPSFIRDTLTNKAGVFNFNDIYPSDTAIYIIQARNKRGKSFNVGIDVDEFKPPVFTASTERMIPWYVNIDSSGIKTLDNYLSYKKEHEKLLGHNMLKEVKIVDKKIIKDSKNLNSDGGSDFSLTTEDLEKAGKAKLGDLLTQKVKGFHLGSGKNPYAYYINGQFMHLIIDGVDITFSFTYDGSGPTAFMHYVKSFLDYYTAEDIKGIEVMRSARYVSSYTTRFLDPLAVPFDHAFVEVTTYSGSGPFLKKTPGVYMYKPLAFSPQKQFYSPRYTVKTQADTSFTDLRSTIYWSPNIITDKNGKAMFSFYTTDKPGTYTLLMDGSDMNGNIESIRQKIIVNNVSHP